MTKKSIVTAGPQLTPVHFDAHFWQQRMAVVGTSGGRNTVWFVAPQQVTELSKTAVQEQWVLRHYYRGGLAGKLIRRTFIYTGLNRTRAVAEFNLLKQMKALGLPVPNPIGAYVRRVGLSYQASVLIERIMGSQDLGRLLLERELSAGQWQQVGATIKRFHQAGVYHSDLNCKNILWREADESVYVIDFDRCFFKHLKVAEHVSQQEQPRAWQTNNLARLRRSFEKELYLAQQQTSIAQFHWTPANWLALMEGYNK